MHKQRRVHRSDHPKPLTRERRRHQATPPVDTEDHETAKKQRCSKATLKELAGGGGGGWRKEISTEAPTRQGPIHPRSNTCSRATYQLLFCFWPTRTSKTTASKRKSGVATQRARLRGKHQPKQVGRADPKTASQTKGKMTTVNRN